MYVVSLLFISLPAHSESINTHFQPQFPHQFSKAFKLHKQVGTYGKYLVPLHIGGAVQHSIRGHTIFARMNPFRGPPMH